MCGYVKASACIVLLACSVAGCGEESTEVSAPERYSQEEDFGVAYKPNLAIDNFAGHVSLGTPNPLGFHVFATKWAESEEDLELIEIEVVEQGDKAHIITSKPPELENATVDLTVRMPPGVSLDIDTGAGKIEFEGELYNRCRFQVGGGSIVLKLPGSTNVKVDLQTGVGVINCAFPVEGEVSNRRVTGKIGDGSDGEIYARVGAGDIHLLRME